VKFSFGRADLASGSVPRRSRSVPCAACCARPQRRPRLRQLPHLEIYYMNLYLICIYMYTICIIDPVWDVLNSKFNSNLNFRAKRPGNQQKTIFSNATSLLGSEAFESHVMAVPTLFLVILVVRFNPASPFMVRRATMNGCDRCWGSLLRLCYHFYFLVFRLALEKHPGLCSAA
jgi:hypothetical protein